MLDELRTHTRKSAYVLIGLLAVLLVYVSYLQVIKSEFLIGHSLNRRSMEAEARIERGQILDRGGEKLAYSQPDENGAFTRSYPYGPICGPLIGYNSSRYGRSGLESSYNGYLSGLTNPERRFGPVTNFWTTKAGNNTILSLDIRLQEIAYRALGNRRGAVVALDPRSGAVLVMVSRPAFDPATIDEEWNTVSTSSDSPLLNRAVQGLYPPGSTLKVLTADAALTEKITNLKQTYVCEGSLKIGPDYVLPESGGKVHGKVDLEEALAVSCNVTFGRLGLELGRSRMAKAFERYGFTKPLDEEMQEATSRLPDFGRLGDGDLAQTAIGQSSLLVTPLRMAMLAAAVANNGVMMKPYLVSRIIAPDGGVVAQFPSSPFLTASDPAIANEVKKMMVAVVNEGTGYGARISRVAVGGKTGTAENPHGQAHAWFIGFAPADNPVIAVAVIVENAGSGGDVAAPIARQVLAEALR